MLFTALGVAVALTASSPGYYYGVAKPEKFPLSQDTLTREWLTLAPWIQQCHPYPWVQAVSRHALTTSPQLVLKLISCRCPISLYFAKTKTTVRVIMSWCPCTTITPTLITPRLYFFTTGKLVVLAAFRTQTFIPTLKANTSKASLLSQRKMSQTPSTCFQQLQATPSLK